MRSTSPPALLLAGMIVGLGGSSGSATLIAAWYFGLTAFALGCAYVGRGLRRWHGALIIGAYMAFVGMVLSSAYSSRAGELLSGALPLGAGLIVAGWLIRSSCRHGNDRSGVGDGATRHQLGQGHAVARLVPLSDADRHDTTAMVNGSTPPAGLSLADSSLVAGWSIGRVWWIALAISSRIAAIDAILGHHVILIGLLIAGQCCGLLTGRWLARRDSGRVGGRARGAAWRPGRDLGLDNASGVPRRGVDRDRREHRVGRRHREAQSDTHALSRYCSASER
jgi:hypothetical protein